MNNDIDERLNAATEPEKHALLNVLRQRLDQLQQPSENVDSASETSAGNVEKNDPHHPAGTPGFQPLNAGTTPGQGRDNAGISPENPDHPAKHDVTESPLDRLPQETQAKILDVLKRHTLDYVTIEVTSPPPYGMGIKTSRSSLHRFLERHEVVEFTRARTENAVETAQQLAELKSEDFTAAATHLIKVRLLETVSAGNSNPSHILALTRSLDRLLAGSHAERRLRLAEQKASGRTAASAVQAGASPAASPPPANAPTPA